MASPPASYTLEIARFNTVSSPDGVSDETLSNAISALRESKATQRYTLGTYVQDKNEIQLTSASDSTHDNSSAETTTSTSDPLANSLHSIYGEPKDLYHVVLDKPAFGPNGAATTNVIEHVQSWFPTSRVTPDFKAQIEADFQSFKAICKGEAKGGSDWTLGWVSEEQEHEKIDEKATCFLVLKGWDSMGDFEHLVNSVAFSEAIPILFAWNAPFKMWHVERKI